MHDPTTVIAQFAITPGYVGAFLADGKINGDIARFFPD